MTPCRIAAIVLIVILASALIAGCSSLIEEKNPDVNASQNPAQPAASYKATLRQPDTQSGYVKMDTDIYNIGEVVEFTVINEGSGTLQCAGAPPSFSVNFQTGNGRWATRMGTGEPNGSVKSPLPPGASTQVYRFVTTGWDPGRYRIVHDCGVERDILIRMPIAITPAATACPAINASDTTPWIMIDVIGDQSASRAFTITGTTNIPAGQDLECRIFSGGAGNLTPPPGSGSSFTTEVEEGGCGTNTWSAMGEIQATGEFVIQVSDTGENVTAIRRFTVFPP
jgi:hypothetical protein